MGAASISGLTITEAGGLSRIALGVSQVLQGIHEEFGIEVDGDPNFRDTPKRVARAYEEIFGGLRDTDKQVKKILSAAFPCTSSNMVVQTGIRVFSMCPHHLLPVDYHVTVAYIPDKGGQVLGLSKLSRLASVLARRPVLQEQFVADVTTALMSLDGCIGAACLAQGRHYCMIMRGANQAEATTVTSSLQGVFLQDAAVKQEFLALAQKAM